MDIFDYTHKIHKWGGHNVVMQLYRQDIVAAYPRYYQYINSEGKWYIMRASKSGNITTYEFYLPAAITTIDSDWTARSNKTYARYDTIF